MGIHVITITFQRLASSEESIDSQALAENGADLLAWCASHKSQAPEDKPATI